MRNGLGLAELQESLKEKIAEILAPRENPALTRLRHKEALQDCLQYLYRFDKMASLDEVLAAEELRMAARALGRITGRVGVEDILDQVFSDFCIGK